MSHFDKKAQEWDSGKVRVDGTLTIADAINQKIDLTSDMEIMDFGVGTGLLGFEIAKMVKKVYGVDTSTKMLEQVEQKKHSNIEY
jgi:predicted TPR repeat methyltransferase